MKCLNCDTNNLENFCSNCGQKNISVRLNLKELKDDFFDSVLNYDNKLIKTIFRIFTNLNLLVTEYFYGKRKKYYNPIKLLFILLSVRTFTEIQRYQIIDDDYSKLINNGFWNFFLLIGLIPLFSLLSFLLFRKYKYNYIEHIIINTLVYCGVSILLTFLNVFNLIIQFKHIGFIGFLIGLFSFAWLYSKVFNQRKIVSIILSFLIYFIGLTIFSVSTNMVTVLL